MAASYYIECNVQPYSSADGQIIGCDVSSGGQIKTRSEVAVSFEPDVISVEDAQEIYPFYLLIISLAWGFKQIGRTIELQ